MGIFLSAVSDQFHDCRNALANDLRAVGAAVREDFAQTQRPKRRAGRTLLRPLAVGRERPCIAH